MSELFYFSFNTITITQFAWAQYSICRTKAYYNSHYKYICCTSKPMSTDLINSTEFGVTRIKLLHCRPVHFNEHCRAFDKLVELPLLNIVQYPVPVYFAALPTTTAAATNHNKSQGIDFICWLCCVGSCCVMTNLSAIVGPFDRFRIIQPCERGMGWEAFTTSPKGRSHSGRNGRWAPKIGSNRTGGEENNRDCCLRRRRCW